MKKTFKIIGIIFTLFIFIVTLSFVVITAISFTTRKPVLIFGYGYGLIETGSMTPMILPGDFVLIQEVEYDELKQYDVIAFTTQDGNYTIVHQIIDYKDGGLLTKGLNNDVDDESTHGIITADRVIGRVTAYGGHEIGSIIINSRSLLIAVVIILIAIIFITQIIGFMKQLKAKQKAKLDEELKEYSEALKRELQKEVESKDQKEKH